MHIVTFHHWMQMWIYRKCIQQIKISIAVNEKITERYWKLQNDHRASARELETDNLTGNVKASALNVFFATQIPPELELQPCQKQNPLLSVPPHFLLLELISI